MSTGLPGLDGQNVLVTGAARGIGRAIAQRLGAEGCVVGVLDLAAEDAERTAGEIVADGGRAFGYEADITDAASVSRALGAFAGQAGPLYALVNNAGWDRAAPFLETDADLWRKIVEINYLGPVSMTHAALERMIPEGRGRIVSIASDAGRVGSSGEAVYAGCKGGVVAFSKSVAREMARHGITLNVVCPGPTDTQLFADFDPTGKLAAALERQIPMRRLGQPGDYPGLVAFLLSDDAAFLTGQTISVSGGLTMHG